MPPVPYGVDATAEQSAWEWDTPSHFSFTPSQYLDLELYPFPKRSGAPALFSAGLNPYRQMQPGCLKDAQSDAVLSIHVRINAFSV